MSTFLCIKEMETSSLSRFPLNIRAIKAKIKIPKRTHTMATVLMLQLEELFEILALKLTQREKNEFEVIHIFQFKRTFHVSSKQNNHAF